MMTAWGGDKGAPHRLDQAEDTAFVPNANHAQYAPGGMRLMKP